MSEKSREQGGSQQSGRNLAAREEISAFSLPFVSLCYPQFTINLLGPILLINVDFPCTPVHISDENVLYNHSIRLVITMVIRRAHPWAPTPLENKIQQIETEGCQVGKRVGRFLLWEASELPHGPGRVLQAEGRRGLLRGWVGCCCVSGTVCTAGNSWREDPGKNASDLPSEQIEAPSHSLSPLLQELLEHNIRCSHCCSSFTKLLF